MWKYCDVIVTFSIYCQFGAIRILDTYVFINSKLLSKKKTEIELNNL